MPDSPPAPDDNAAFFVHVSTQNRSQGRFSCWEQAQKNARYVNGQKMSDWTNASGVQFPSRSSNQHGNIVYTEADLVNSLIQILRFHPESAADLGEG